MTKEQFLAALASALDDLPQKDIEDSLAYYGEMIDDKIEAGESEASAVAGLGDPLAVAREIRLDVPLATIIKTKCNPRRALRVWEIVLLVLGSPIWLSLLVAVAAVVLSVYAVLFSLAATCWALDLSLLALFPVGVLQLVLNVSVSGTTALFYLGTALFGAGASVAMFFVCLLWTRLIVRLGVQILRGIKRLILGKDGKK